MALGISLAPCIFVEAMIEIRKMRHLHKLVVITVLGILPTFVRAQSLAYKDATSPLGAVAMLQTTIRAARHMQDRCIERYPELTEPISNSLQKWLLLEQPLVKKASLLWPKMLKYRPETANLLGLIDQTIDSSIENASKLAPLEGRDFVKDLCSQHFNDLAAGVWRRRTPNAYYLLEKMDLDEFLKD
jgi:hypothetical protein